MLVLHHHLGLEIACFDPWYLEPERSNIIRIIIKIKNNECFTRIKKKRKTSCKALVKSKSISVKETPTRIITASSKSSYTNSSNI